MCGRYVLVQSIELIEKRFNVTLPIDFDWKPNYNIGPGSVAPVITSEHPNQLSFFKFGITPYWAKKQMYLFNARAEGDRNSENDPNYSGAKDILIKPSFRKPIRSQRCLVIADAFIEGTMKDGLAKPYLVFLRSRQRPFAFAGIYDTWEDPKTNELLSSFAIITTAGNDFMQMIPHNRCPLILKPEQEAKWLNTNTPLTDITKMMHPVSSDMLNAFPISPEIKNIANNALDLIQPKGLSLFQNMEIKTTKELRLQGMGSGKKTIQSDKTNPTIF